MLFRQDALDRIRSGRVSVVFRRWRYARVRAGSRLRTMIGLIEVKSVAHVICGPCRLMNVAQAPIVLALALAAE